MDSRNNLGKILKQRRSMIPLTLQELAGVAGVSASHLGRIERGERFPSARVLRKIAKHLEFDEGELFILAEYMSPQSRNTIGNETQPGRLDPYVASILSQEPLEIQRAVTALLIVMKNMKYGA